MHSIQLVFPSFIYSGTQWICCSIVFPICFSLLALLAILLAVTFATSYLPYNHYLHGNEDIRYHHILENDTVPCGSGNSRQDEGITVQAVLTAEETLTGTFIAVVTPRDDLKLYSKQWGPYHMNGDFYYSCYLELFISNIVLWIGSNVSGYFCIQNQNTTEQNATLYVFTSEDDADRFQTGGKPENYVLSDFITIPPSQTEYCFQQWDKGRPFIANTSAYHYFVIQVSSRNMTFRYNVTVLQKYPDINDYDNQKTFTCGSDDRTCTQRPTYLPFQRTVTTSKTDFIAICKAPLDTAKHIFNLNHTNTTYNLSAEAIHIRSKVVPHRWTKPLAIATTALGILALIVLTVFLVVCCVACVKYRRRIFCNGYTCKYVCSPERCMGYRPVRS